MALHRELCSTLCGSLDGKGREFKGEWIHTCVRLSTFAVHLKLLQHCQPAVLQYKIKFFLMVLIMMLLKNKQRFKKLGGQNLKSMKLSHVLKNILAKLLGFKLTFWTLRLGFVSLEMQLKSQLTTNIFVIINLE